MAKRKAVNVAPEFDEPETHVDVVESTDVPSIPSEPTDAIIDSYTWASAVPRECGRTDDDSGSGKVPCVLGVDEAGRGPVLGPLVYGIAYCPLAYHDTQLKEIGFADSKALTAERRDALLGSLISEADHLGWAVRVMSPQDISAGMLRKRPVNLNAQSSQATVELIAGVLAAGVDVTEIYVDTVGDPKSYSRLLSSYFPRHSHIKWTVTSKADAIYPIVGAASIAAKVTRDRCIEKWHYAEARKGTSKIWPDLGALGSGYPGDPNTVAFLKRTLDPVFGWPGIVRFSWATAKTMMEDKVKLPSNNVAISTKANGTTTRSLSRTNSVVMDENNAVVPPSTSLYGTALAVPKPGSTVTRAYKVKWIDEPVAISKFFGTVKAKSASIPTTDDDHPFRLSETQHALNACMLQEPQWRAKASNTGSANVGKLQKEIGLISCAATFV